MGTALIQLIGCSYSCRKQTAVLNSCRIYIRERPLWYTPSAAKQRREVKSHCSACTGGIIRFRRRQDGFVLTCVWRCAAVGLRQAADSVKRGWESVWARLSCITENPRPCSHLVSPSVPSGHPQDTSRTHFGIRDLGRTEGPPTQLTSSVKQETEEQEEQGETAAEWITRRLISRCFTATQMTCLLTRQC